ncbi:DNA mismatch repair endonuclease MutL [Pseudocnuella soli]|uniref:DNA mismatch repair endonuclease MutL n=1 Tax=Pseudocnuella soli TaxID=2502779 RepID=UPI00104F2B2F|nr:DNA mismatch repair endonuclease MutL [Pseudocnuella soli]
MADRILLLPDNIANQIAAGEVIQRPASAVKELLENAVDAGATEIKLLVADAGKALVQVIDNGSGMSETDARMAFERHATSKIRNINDLFSIRTMGFRGEALASIAAVAQVELRTRRNEDEVGTCLDMENSQVVKQGAVAAPVGTSIAMKNLFFNVPARRNFLKSNTAELRHIIDEFMRVALAFPHLFFSMHSNGQQLFHLDGGSLKQRIVQLLGAHYNQKLVAVKEETDYLNIHGFVGKPDTAKKTRGDQYFFVNNRFIRSAYLAHAVQNAYQELIPADTFPAYVLFIDLDPAQVDVNVHPTKQEIKFEDEKIVYAFVQAAVKHALAQFSITPTLDFELDASIQGLESVQQPFTEEKASAISASALFQTFSSGGQAHKIEPSRSSGGFPSLRDFSSNTAANSAAPQHEPAGVGITPDPGFSSLLDAVRNHPAPALHDYGAQHANPKLTQLFNTYILVPQAHKFLLVHQQAAHERILYDRMAQSIDGRPIAAQRSLFPTTIELAPADAILLQELIPDLAHMGYSIEPFGKSAFVIQGTPADVGSGNERQVLEKILEQYKHFNSELRLSKREMLLRSVAWQQAIKGGTTLTESEMQSLVTDLFACATPNATPSGRPTYTEFKKELLDKQFGR